MLKIAVLVSGSGSNLQSIIDCIEKGELNCSIEAVISDRLGTYGIERAKKKNIASYVFDRKIYGETISDAICDFLDEKVDLIVLAGFLSILRGKLLDKFADKIINIHPSLIPSFCGTGMYGIRVHESAISYGVKVSGCTVHFVDGGTDSGAIILQSTVPVFDDDTPYRLQQRVIKEEHKLLPKAVSLIADGKVSIEGRKVVLQK